MSSDRQTIKDVLLSGLNSESKMTKQWALKRTLEMLIGCKEVEKIQSDEQLKGSTGWCGTLAP